jgi:3-methyladenine DNA glycosylase/8-oxoguanine DNA glycosylase
MTDLQRRSRSADGTSADWLERARTHLRKILALAERWRPFRSLATSYIFASAFDRDDVEA